MVAVADGPTRSHGRFGEHEPVRPAEGDWFRRLAAPGGDGRSPGDAYAAESPGVAAVLFAAAHGVGCGLTDTEARDVYAEIERLRAVVGAVRGIHAPRSEQNADLTVQRTLCPECLDVWPCDTARAVGFDKEEDIGG